MDQPLVQEMADTVIPVPLVIAVSGHRNLVPAEIPEVKKIVREFLEYICTNSGKLPVAVLTPLAEGAGQLVAREALRLGLQLIVPLPLPKDLYRQGLASEPHIHEDIAVRLVKAQWGKYDLDLSIDKDPANALAKQKLSRSVTVLEDDNRAPSVAKFTISLTPIGKGIIKPADLDPRVVNE